MSSMSLDATLGLSETGTPPLLRQIKVRRLLQPMIWMVRNDDESVLERGPWR